MKYPLKELVDISRLQELTDNLYLAAGIPSAIITQEGEILTGSGWQRICTEFHRQHPEIERDCIASDTAIRDRLRDGDPFAMYTCPRGLTDASIPIVIEGEHLANAFAGQLFLEQPTASTEQWFREQARHFGMDEEAYVAALHEVPVLPLGRFRPALMFLAQLAKMIAELGLQRKRELEALDQIRRAGLDRDRLEGQLQQAMKMEAVGRLAGGVAHDFNNLLTTITGNVSLALMDLRPEDPLTMVLNEVGKAADSAASLTRQLLAFSRKQIIEPRVIDLNELIGDLHRMLARLIGEDIELRTVCGGDLGAVRVDPGQFEQVLVNLVVNARDAMPDGGQLVVESANVELDAEYCAAHPQVQPGRFVMLAVSDTGHGMSLEVKEHLFEPFFTTKARGRGTGLGLATIFGAVQQSGGAIEVYSEVGQGTTFKIYLPRIESKAERLIREPRGMALLEGHETVLLVEDDSMVRDLAIRVLKKLGYRVLAAPDGQQAVVLAERRDGPIDLLMTDVVMPGMNGRQLAEQLTRIMPGLRVLFTSGYTENIIVHHGVVEANLNFISKPYAPQALARKLREVFEQP